MNQVTTIAALPSGGGQAAHLPPEVVAEAARPYLGIPAALAPETPAERQGFEPFDYTERS